MSRNGETKIRYLSIDEMLARIEELRARRASEQHGVEIGLDYVAAFEQWAAAEAQVAEAGLRGYRDTVATGRTSHRLPSAAFAGDDYVWIGDDMAIRLSPADPVEEELPRSAVELGATGQHAPWRAIPAAMLNRWNAERYALTTVAVGILALIVGGTGLRMIPEHRGQPMVASAYDLQAGHEPVEEIQSPDALSTLVAEPEMATKAAAVRHAVHPAVVEDQIKTALARDGFHDVGVSAGKRGDVYLAGDVYNLVEARNILRIARHAVRVARVFFLHPEVRPAQGPAYFGAVAEYAPDVWGAKVSHVTIGSPAFQAGVRPGDVIREFDHHTVADANELQEAVRAHRPGDRIEVRVWRGGENLFTIARLRDRSTTQVAMR
jgi:hypothetical protein